jgi:hypothetical protein
MNPKAGIVRGNALVSQIGSTVIGFGPLELYPAYSDGFFTLRIVLRAGLSGYWEA